MSTTYALETIKFGMSKDGLRYTLQFEADCIKCTIENNHFCKLSTPQYQTNTHTYCVSALLRHSGIDQYCRVNLFPLNILQAVYLGQGN